MSTNLTLSAADYDALVAYLEWQIATPEWFDFRDSDHDRFSNYEFDMAEKLGIEPEGFNCFYLEKDTNRLIAEFEDNREEHVTRGE